MYNISKKSIFLCACIASMGSSAYGMLTRATRATASQSAKRSFFSHFQRPKTYEALIRQTLNADERVAIQKVLLQKNDVLEANLNMQLKDAYHEHNHNIKGKFTGRELGSLKKVRDIEKRLAVVQKQRCDILRLESSEDEIETIMRDRRAHIGGFYDGVYYHPSGNFNRVSSSE